jgi:peptidoglycan/xylan/chitin deacetylase (PgdA/CDA1 family)
VVVSSCSRPGIVALTFDDGPYIYTSQLLDMLSGAGMTATFFVNGRNCGANDITGGDKSALVQRMVAEGHQVASHTWDHADLSTLSDGQVAAEMTQLETALMGIIGKAPTYMRAPYFSCGAACLNVMNSLGYHVIGTDLDVLDWQGSIQNSRNIFNGALSAASPSDKSFIALAHDVHSATVNSIVPYMISTMQARGFRAATVGECLGDPAANWYRTV